MIGNIIEKKKTNNDRCGKVPQNINFHEKSQTNGMLWCDGTALPREPNWLISLITLTRWRRGNVPWEISGRKDTEMIQFD